MEAQFKFEKLIIWQRAMDFGEEIQQIERDFPKKEIYNLSSQICRAADSIALNISEGAILQSKLEFKKFMGYSIRSLAEVVSCLHKAKRREYITEKQFKDLYEESFNIMNMMISFRSKIR
ncbi:four helix bundle protein [Aureibaculum algae]|uniref:Four helix bundle protein n=1 Tax=Aureibaculum algae TaxID=2584122 RepID=A0A5B7TV89_9FLAO|nr:four helix bundle protein [Aureibaculum algae]QCX38807.1 four helix bundle protein [Aureibaculum algae]